MKSIVRGALAGLPLLLLSAVAEAHSGHGAVSGVGAGIAHPLGGLDHMLAMLAVGVLCVQMSGRAVWAIPATFVAMMVVGGVIGLGGVAVPLVEPGIVGSVIVLGAVIAGGRHLPVFAAVPFVGVFAVFHGYAHGAEMPAGASALEFGIGFILSTVLLHAAGAGLGIVSEKLGRQFASVVIRVTGTAIAVAGVTLSIL